MRKLLIIPLVIALFIFGCEDIYDPGIESVEPLLVVEARIIYGNIYNEVRLYKTIRFNDPANHFPPASEALVTLTDDRNSVIILPEGLDGRYRLMQNLDPRRRYRLKIVYDGETYESEYEFIPELPSIDSVYVVPATKLIETGNDESARNLRKALGSQLYIDIKGTGSESHFRFTGRKIVQYNYTAADPVLRPPMEGTMFAWTTLYPSDMFNIAGPPEYSVSNDIIKFPLEFMERSYTPFIPDTPTIFMGWIYICQQYALSENAFNFYQDLNSQLSAGGKLFDPLYTQARGNIRCTSDPDKIILGNFEISTVREHRFYVQWLRNDDYYVKRIPYFWNIPPEGKVFNIPPVWWEYIGKVYPWQ